MKLPAPCFPRNDVGPGLFLREEKVSQVPFICKDRIMEGDGIKMLVLTFERLLCFLGDTG